MAQLWPHWPWIQKESSESRFMELGRKNYRKPRGHAMLSGRLERWAKASPSPWKKFNANQLHLMGFLMSLPSELMSSDTAMLRVPSWAGQQQCTQLRGSLGHPGMQETHTWLGIILIQKLKSQRLLKAGGRKGEILATSSCQMEFWISPVPLNHKKLLANNQWDHVNAWKWHHISPSLQRMKYEFQNSLQNFPDKTVKDKHTSLKILWEYKRSRCYLFKVQHECSCGLPLSHEPSREDWGILVSWRLWKPPHTKT